MSKRKGNQGNKSTGRPKPMTPKAGFTKTKRRYDCGGKLSK